MATTDKLSIGNELAKLDAKDREFYDSLSEDEKKKFSPFLMIRWAADVSGSVDMQSYYLMSVNEKLNKNFFDISTTHHKKLQWLLATTISPGLGSQRHTWLAAKKKESSSKSAKFLRTLYPHMKEDEIDLLGRINNTDDLKLLATRQGWTKEQIKSAF